MDRVGQHLGNYRLIRLLGEGAFATVYLGEHVHLGSHTAIKILQARLAGDELERFLSEARTIAHLEHPHIVRVLEFGVEDGTPFLVMSYAPQGTLRHRHPKRSQLSLETILPYVRQVASALQYAHAAKLIHRDVKPENMLLSEDGQVWLSDFGIAAVAHSSQSQSTQEVAGTVGYMAPEQLQGHAQPASDQYALGIVIYEWLTGVRPFQGSFLETAAQHVLSPPPPLHDQVPGVSPLVEQVVLTALAKDPKTRFASIQAFAHALEQATQAGPFLFAPTQVSGITNFITPPPGAATGHDNSTRPAASFTTMPAVPAPASPEIGKAAGVVPRPEQLPPARSNRFYARVLLGLLGVVVLASLGSYFATRIPIHVGEAPATPTTKSLAPTITEFDLIPNEPAGITVGPDGNIWFTDSTDEVSAGVPCCDIGHMTLTGAWVGLPLALGQQAASIVTGPDNNLWFTDPKNSAIGRMTAKYALLPEFPLSSGSMPNDITVGPDENLWFTDDNPSDSNEPGRIGRITSQGVVTEYSFHINRSSPQKITVGPDGNLWFTDAGQMAEIGRITPQGKITEFPLPPAGLDDPQGITSGPDGNLWFADRLANLIGRITPQGKITEFSLPSKASRLGGGIVTGPDGNLWFTDAGDPAQIGRVSPDGKSVKEFAISGDASDPAEIIAGPQNSLWFIDLADQIGRVTFGN
jgi:serine/threonine protein kinase/streptogramin lyase